MVRIAVALLLIAGFALLVIVAGTSEKDPAPAAPLTLVRADDCRECHPQVYEEWKNSWHAMAWLDPFVREKQMADNFKKKDCIPCHAPRPIFERGLGPGQRVVERASFREDGVDCISCHKLPEGGFASAHEGVKGPCDPVPHPGIRSVALCTPCHNQHNTVDEWSEAPEDLRGENCNECHMPRVKRTTGRARMGRTHTFPGGHDITLLKNAVSLSHELLRGEAGRMLKAVVKNDKTAHNFPTDSRHRAVDLIITFYREGGMPYPSAGEKRPVGQEPGTHRVRFRNPYRSETGMEDTQIRAGQEGVIEAPVPEGAAEAQIQLIYKLRPFMLDRDGIELINIKVDLQ
ncbi:MAG: multiheme c-type cytochrome [Planctomycetota bacterium]